jgi:predicted nucleic acid-binding protein
MPSTVGVADSPAWVLDTNAVLDWLVFRDPACASWTERMVSGSVRWLVIPAMRDELNHVLARCAARGWNADLRALWSAWERLSHSADLLPLAGAATRMRCTDPDDQKFIDLALGHRARWLVTRDRAVLKLARRARTLGLNIVTPEAVEDQFSGD